MPLPAQLELQTLFSGFLLESGLSAVSVKNYLSDLRHFFSFCASISPVIPGTDPESIPTVQEIFQDIPKYLDLYLTEQKKSFTPQNTINRRSASIRRFSTFLSSKFGLTTSNIVGAIHESPTAIPTIGKILDHFRHFLEKEKKTHSTVKNYLSDLNHFFAWSASSTPFMDQDFENLLSESQLNAYVTYLRLSHISTSVIARRQSSIRQFTKYCFLQKYLPNNPFEYNRLARRIGGLAPLSWFDRFSSRNKPSKNGSKGRFAMLYQKYNSLPFTPYLHLAILVLATSAMVVFGYNQIIKQATPSSAALPTVPRRQLSFQGRLTDSSGTPITTTVNVVFKLWSHLTAGSELYTSGTCAITADANGIFNTIIGGGVCGTEITSTVFTENRDVYLAVTVGAETLTPRQQIATVGYALNSETLQGYPASASATVNTVPLVNGDGDIIIASASPDIISSSGTFTISGQTLALQTTTNSGGDVVIQPDAIGNGEALVLGSTTSTDTFHVANANLTSGNLIAGYVGNNTATGRLLSLTAGSSETDRFYVAASGQTAINTGATLVNAALKVNQNGTGDLFTASASGATKYTLGNTGNITATGTLTGLTGLTVASGTVSLPSGEIGNTEISELDWTKLQNYPSACPAGQAIQQVGDTLSCIDIAGSSGNLWQQNLGSLAPLNITDSLNLGSTATTSALVHFPGTNNQNAWFNLGTGNVGIGTTNPVQKLHVEGQCITGDSLLSVVPSGQDSSQFTVHSSQIETIPIKDVKPGIKVYSLNEETGKVEPARINKLLDMGVKPVFKLITESGKEIRTTGNHPYLVQLNNDEFSSRVQLRETRSLEESYGLSQGSLSATYEFSQTRELWTDRSIAQSSNVSPSEYSGGEREIREQGISPVSLSSTGQSVRDGGLSQTGTGTQISNPATSQPDTFTNSRDQQNAVWSNRLPQETNWVKVIYLSPGDFIATVSFLSVCELSTVNCEPYVVWDKIQSIEYVGEEQVYDIEVEGTHNFIANGILAHNTYMSGNVGIGTISPGSKLEVAGNITLSGTTTAGAPVLSQYYSSPDTGMKYDAPGRAEGWYGIHDFYTGYNGAASTLAMRIKNGNVGIGTTGPLQRLDLGSGNMVTTGKVAIGTTDITGFSSQLQVSGTDNNTIVGANSGARMWLNNASTTVNTWFPIWFSYGSSNNGAYAGIAGQVTDTTNNYGSFVMSTRGADGVVPRLTINSSGNVGIGTTGPSYKLDVSGTGRFTGTVVGADATLSTEFVTLSQLQGGTGSLWLDGGDYLYPNTSFASNTMVPSGRIGVGLTSTPFKLEVTGNDAGKALASLNYTGTDQNILVASQSGTLKFAVGYNGNLTSAAGAKWLPAADSSTALNVANAAGTSFVTFDSTNSRVGIGTTGPTEKFVVSNSASNYTGFNVKHESSGGGNYLFAVTGGTHPQPGAFGFYDNTAAAYRMLITSTGKISVGANYTVTPASNLSVNGNMSIGTNYMTTAAPSNGIIIEGNVGIGTTSPSELLHLSINDSGVINNDPATWGQLYVQNTNTTSETTAGIHLKSGSFDAGIFSITDGGANTGRLALFTDSASAEKVSILASGNVGIGTTGPGALLDVKGNAIIGSPNSPQGRLSVSAAASGGISLHLTDAVNSTLLISHPTTAYSTGSTRATQIYSDSHLGLSGGSATNQLFLHSAGNVGIGTTGPNKVLDIRGDSIVYSSNGSYSEGWSVFYTGSSMYGGGINFHLGSAGTVPSASTFKSYIRVRGDNGNLVVGNYKSSTAQEWIPIEIDNSNNNIYFLGRTVGGANAGNVGIGTTGPGSLLHIRKDSSPGANPTAGTALLTLENQAAWGSSRILFNGYSGAPMVAIDQLDTGGSTSALTFWTATNAPVTEKVRITDTGNVGIGTTGPSDTLYVQRNAGNNNGGITLNNAYGSGWGSSFTFRGVNTPGANILGSFLVDSVGTGGRFLFRTGDTSEVLRNRLVLQETGAVGIGGAITNSVTLAGASMVINSSGNVGIGTTAPSAKLHISGDMRLTGALYDVNNGVGTSGQVLSSTVSGTDWVDITSIGIGGSGTTNYIPKFTASTTLGNSVLYETSGNVGIGTTNPGSLLDVYKSGTGYTTLATIENPGDPGTGATGLQVSNTASSLLFRAYGSTAPGILASAAGILGLSGSSFLIGGAGATMPTYIYSYNNYATPELTIKNGNIGIGTTNPLAALEIGGSGNVRVGGLTASSAVYTDVNKQLTSTPPGSGTLGYWQRNGTNLAPATITDNVGIGTTSPSNAFQVGTSDFAVDSVNHVVALAGQTPYSSYQLRMQGKLRFEGNGVIDMSGGGSWGGSGTLTLNPSSGNVILNPTAGNVGIGTTGPGSKLHLYSGASGATTYTTTDLTIEDSGNALIGFISPNTTAQGFLFGDPESNTVGQFAYYHSDNSMRFTTNATEAMRITTSGNVGIGTAAPGAKLTVDTGIVRIQSASQTAFGDTTTGLNIVKSSSGGKEVGLFLVDLTSTGASGRVYVKNGNTMYLDVGTYNESSTINAMTLNSSGNVAIPNGTLTVSGTGNSSIAGNIGIGTTGPGYKLDVNGTVNIPVNTWITGGGNSLIRDSYFGYSTGYRVAHIGGTLAGTRGIAIGIDPTSITGGAFTGNEIAFPNSVEFMQANSGGTDWIQSVLVLNNGNVSTTGTLTVSGTGNSSIAGNVGIGTAGPGNKLHVVETIADKSAMTLRATQNAAFGSGDTGKVFQVQNAGTGDNFFFLDASSGSAGDIGLSMLVQGVGGWMIGLDNSDSDKLKFSSTWDNLAGGAKVTFQQDGNVGIGTISPLQKLHVAGNCVTYDTILPIIVNKLTSGESQDDPKASETTGSELSSASLQTAESSEPSPTPQNLTISRGNAKIHQTREIETPPNREVSLTRIDQIKGGEMVLSLNEQTGKLEPQKIKGLLDMGVQPVYKLTTADGKTIRTTGNHPYLTKNGWTKVINLEKGEAIAVAEDLFTFGSVAYHSVNNNRQRQTQNSQSQIEKDKIISIHDFTLINNKLDSQNTNETTPPNNTSGRLNLSSKKGITTEAKDTWATSAQISDSLLNLASSSFTGDNSSTNGIKFVKIASIEYVGEEQVYDIEVENTHNFVANGIIAHNTYISTNLNIGVGLTTPAFTMVTGAGASKVFTSDASGNASWGDITSVGIGGSGTANYLPKFTAPTTLGNSLLYDNGTNVGIGTTSPLATLDIAGSASASGNLTFRGSGTTHLINLYDNGSLQIGNSVGGGTATPAFVVTSAGNIGIGTTSPGAKLDVSSATGGGNTGLKLTQIANNGTAYNSYVPIEFYVPTTGIIGQFLATASNYSDVLVDLPSNSLGLFAQAASGSLVLGAAGASGDVRILTGGFGVANERVRITTTGNVGIGTTGPNSKLNVVAGDGVAAVYATATNSYGVYGYSASSYGVYANAAGSSAALYAVQTTGTAVQGTVIGAGTGIAGYFNQSGTLTGNATNPAAYVLRNQVLGAYTSTGAILKLEDTTASTGNLLELIKQGSTKVVVDSTGNVGIGTTSPASLLDVNGTAWLRGVAAGTSGLFVNASGNVGIGTTGPSTFKLETAGSIGPSADNTYDLGSSGRKWANVYATNFVGGITPSGFTQGPVIFGGSGGALAQDNALFWNNTSKYLGIGTTGPGAKLDVRRIDSSDGDAVWFGSQGYVMGRLGEDPSTNTVYLANSYSSSSIIDFRIGGSTSAYSKMIIKNGNVGIGTTSPSEKLVIIGNVMIPDSYKLKYNYSAIGEDIDDTDGLSITSDAGENIYLGNTPTGSGSPTMFIGGINNGNVGIGTTGPGTKLHIQNDAADVAMTIQTDSTLYDANLIIDRQNWDREASVEFLDNGGVNWEAGMLGNSNYDFSIKGSNNGRHLLLLPGTGNVGIGTTAPSYKLDVSGTGRFTGTVVGADATLSTEFVTLSQLQGGTGSLWLDGGDYLYPNTSFASNAMVPSGRVGVGVTSTPFKFEVSGNDAGKALASLNYTGTDQNILVASQSGTLKFAVGYNGNLTSAAGAKWLPSADSSTALNVANAAGTSFVTFDSTNSRVGIGTTGPVVKLHVAGKGSFGDSVTASNSDRALNLSSTDAVMSIKRIHASYGPGIELISRATADGSNVAEWMLAVDVNNNFAFLERIGGDEYPVAINSSHDVGFGNSITNLSTLAGANVVIKSTGNVGIGTTSPGYKLHIVNNGVATLRFENTADNSIAEFRTGQSIGAIIGTVSNKPLQLMVNNSSLAQLHPSGGFSLGTSTSGYLTADPGAGSMIIQGNVGIGTTSPSQKLHVAGNCITGDSLLSIIVNKPSSEDPQGNFPASETAGTVSSTVQGEIHLSTSEEKLQTQNLTISRGNAENQQTLPAGRQVVKVEPSPTREVELTRIDQIKGGEQVLSLNEQTGKLEPQKIKGLLDMGVQPVYKLTTADGKTIRTTGNHPYLTISSLPKEYISQEPLLKTTTLPSGSFLNSSINNSKEPNSSSISFWATRNQTRANNLSSEYKPDLAKSASLVTNTRPSFLESEATFSSELPLGTNLTSNPLDSRNENNSTRTFSSSRNLNTEVEGDIISPLCQGDSIAQSRSYCRGGQGRKSLNDLANSSPTFEHFQNLPNHNPSSLESGFAVTNLRVGNDMATDNNSFHQDYYNKEVNEVKKTAWVKVIYLQVGNEIAVADSGEAKFVKIASIEYVGEEQVYDIEVENTHNFVANGIIAHNTYISTTLNIGVGLTTPAFTMVTGAGTNKVFTSDASGNAAWSAITSVGIGGSGTTNYLPKFTASTTLGNSLLYDNGTNVGIGTTSPLATLDIAGSASASGNLTFRGAGTTHLINLYDNGSLQIGNSVGGGTATPRFVIDSSGQVGIGTTGPGSKLEVSQGSNQAQLALTNPDTAAITNTMPLVFKAKDDGGNSIEYAGVFGRSTAIVDAANQESGALTFHTKTLGNTGIDERMRIDGTGNVGIGTTGPGQKLTVQGDGARLRLQTESNPSTYYFDIESNYSASNTVNFYGAGGSNFLRWIYNGPVLALMPTEGNVGIGTTSPSERLYVDSGSDGNVAVFDASSGSFGEIQIMDADMSVPGRLRYDAGEFQMFVGNSVQAVTVQSLGNVGIGTTGPGAKLHVYSGASGTTPVAGSIITSESSGDNLLSLLAPNANTSGLVFGSVNSNVDAGIYYFGGGAPFGRGLRFKINGNQDAVLITSSGNVGIGTTNPGAKLEVAGGNILLGNYYALDAKNTSGTAGHIAWMRNDNIVLVGDISNVGGAGAGLVAAGAGAPQIFINQSGNTTLTGTLTVSNTGNSSIAGNVGIGTTAPGTLLHLSRDTQDGISYLTIQNTNAENYPRVNAVDFKSRLQGTTTDVVMANLKWGRSWDISSQDNSVLSLGARNNAGSLVDILYVASANKMTLLPSGGNVGIGTADPGTAGLAIMNGNVGIGTTGPGAKLFISSGGGVGAVGGFSGTYTGTPQVWNSINSSSEVGYALYTNDGSINQRVKFFNNGSAAGIWQETSSGSGVPYVFGSVSTEWMRISNAGNVGIGTTGPGADLEVVGKVGTGATALKVTSDGNADDKVFHFIGNASLPAYQMVMMQTGNVGIGTTGPLYKTQISSANAIVNYWPGTYPQLAVFSNDSQAINKGGQIVLGGMQGSGAAASDPTAFGSIAGRKENGTSGNYAGYLQFSTTGSDSTISEWMRITSSGNVSIGTVSAFAKLSVQDYVTISSNTTDDRKTIYGDVSKKVESGFTDSGSSQGYSIDVLRNSGTTGDSGTLANLTGINVQYGHYSLDAAATPITTNAYGIWLRPYYKKGTITNMYDIYLAAGSTGGTVTNGWGIYQASTKNNYFAGNIGIGTTAPGSKLSVAGGASFGSTYASSSAPTDGMIIQGNVGIGTTGPNYALDVYKTSAGLETTPLNLRNDSQINGTAVSLGFTAFDSNIITAKITNLRTSTGNYALTFSNWTGPANTEIMRLDNNGNVGIGTTGPGQKLDVAGNIHATGYPLFGTDAFSSATSYAEFYNSQNAEVSYGFSNASTGSSAYTQMIVGQPRSTNNYVALVYTSTGYTGAPNTAYIGNTALTTNNGITFFNNLAAPFKFNVNNAGDPEVIITSTGNVGIGTTSPQAKLHVNGNCVTGDTILPIRRRRRRKSNGLEPDNDDPLWDYLPCRIDEIQPGDEVLSLNEGQWDRQDVLSEDQDNIGSGTLQYAKINALKDMGVQEVYELVTKSGRKIRTTANHPYLTLLEDHPIINNGKINI